MKAVVEPVGLWAVRQAEETLPSINHKVRESAENQYLSIRKEKHEWEETLVPRNFMQDHATILPQDFRHLDSFESKTGCLTPSDPLSHWWNLKKRAMKTTSELSTPQSRLSALLINDLIVQGWQWKDQVISYGWGKNIRVRQSEEEWGRSFCNHPRKKNLWLGLITHVDIYQNWWCS